MAFIVDFYSKGNNTFFSGPNSTAADVSNDVNIMYSDILSFFGFTNIGGTFNYFFTGVLFALLVIIGIFAYINKNELGINNKTDSFFSFCIFGLLILPALLSYPAMYIWGVIGIPGQPPHSLVRYFTPLYIAFISLAALGLENIFKLSDNKKLRPAFFILVLVYLGILFSIYHFSSKYSLPSIDFQIIVTLVSLVGAIFLINSLIFKKCIIGAASVFLAVITLLPNQTYDFMIGKKYFQTTARSMNVIHKQVQNNIINRFIFSNYFSYSMYPTNLFVILDIAEKNLDNPRTKYFLYNSILNYKNKLSWRIRNFNNSRFTDEIKYEQIRNDDAPEVKILTDIDNFTFDLNPEYIGKSIDFDYLTECFSGSLAKIGVSFQFYDKSNKLISVVTYILNGEDDYWNYKDKLVDGVSYITYIRNNYKIGEKQRISFEDILADHNAKAFNIKTNPFSVKDISKIKVAFSTWFNEKEGGSIRAYLFIQPKYIIKYISNEGDYYNSIYLHVKNILKTLNYNYKNISRNTLAEINSLATDYNRVVSGGTEFFPIFSWLAEKIPSDSYFRFGFSARGPTDDNFADHFTVLLPEVDSTYYNFNNASCQRWHSTLDYYSQDIKRIINSDYYYAANMFPPENNKIADILNIEYALAKPEDLSSYPYLRDWQMIGEPYIYQPIFKESPDEKEAKYILIKNPTVIPRASVYYNTKVIKPFKTNRHNLYSMDRIEYGKKQLESLDHQQQLLIEADISEISMHSDKPRIDDVKILNILGNFAIMRVSSKSPGVLFYSDMYHEDWHAYIDSKETKIYRANLSFKGVLIPEGEHVLWMEFRSRPLIWFKIVSLLIIVVTLFLYMKNQTREGNG